VARETAEVLLGNRVWQRSRWSTGAVALTVFDAAATAVWLELGIATEGNPLLAQLIEVVGAGTAMLLRSVVGVALVLSLAAMSATSQLARRAMPAITVTLAAVAGYHLVGAALSLA